MNERRPMRIFPRNTTPEEERYYRKVFDRIASEITASEIEPEPTAIKAPAQLSWWKRLFGKVG